MQKYLLIIQPNVEWKKIILNQVQKQISFLDFSFLWEYVQGGFAVRLEHKVNNCVKTMMMVMMMMTMVIYI